MKDPERFMTGAEHDHFFVITKSDSIFKHFAAVLGVEPWHWPC